MQNTRKKGDGVHDEAELVVVVDGGGAVGVNLGRDVAAGVLLRARDSGKGDKRRQKAGTHRHGSSSLQGRQALGEKNEKVSKQKEVKVCPGFRGHMGWQIL